MKQLGLVLALVVTGISFAETKAVRWTGFDDKNGNLAHVLEVLNTKTGFSLTEKDFKKIEDRPLATSRYVYFAQVGNNIPLKRKSLQLWTTLEGGELIQAEATVDTPLPEKTLRFLSANAFLSSRATMEIVQRVVKTHLDDRSIRGVKWEDYWDNAQLVRAVRVKGKHGTHTIEISIAERRLLSQRYEEFPQVSGPLGHDTAAEFSLPVKVYPIYEEIEEDRGGLLPRIDSTLPYLSSKVAANQPDVYAPLKAQRYFDNKYDPLLGLTVEGRKAGFWSLSFLKDQAAELFSKVPLIDNTFAAGLVVLEGRYATINLEPKVPATFKELNFVPAPTSIYLASFKPSSEDPQVEEMIPTTTLRGKPLKTAGESLTRPARRLADHSAVEYLNDGFDEMQVYWSINRMFDALRPMGFTDPELSTRRFNAFLYDPDVSMRNNAYYNEDTINFTTYSPSHANMARDNTTIWHELGHGVMDRLMGDQLRLADTGGLSEGMADFVAQMVLNDVTNTQTFPGKEKMRVINHTGFNLTNEVHDDGEAYGGSMNDMLEAAIAKDGRAGLTKITDLVMEAMRLSRNNPALTANGWYERMLFADQRGNAPVRSAGEFRATILKALAGRNFNVDGSPVASFSFKNGEQEVVANSPGSRQNPIRLNLKKDERKAFTLNLNLKSSPSYQFEYPIKVEVGLKGGPIQGAIAWENEAAQPLVFEIKNEGDVLPVEVAVRGVCDEFNRDDKSCVDFAYVKIFNRTDRVKPVSKKRFYLRIYPQE